MPPSEQFQSPQPFEERRHKKKDWVAQAVSVISCIGWLTVVILLLLLEKAQPAQANFFTYLFGAPVNSAWNQSMLRIVLVLLVVVFFVSVAGLVCNMLRHRRAADRYRKSILILNGVSILGIVIFSIRFLPYL